MNQFLFIPLVKGSKFLNLDEKLFQFRPLPMQHYVFLYDGYF